MLTIERAEEILKDSEALLTGHFLLTSGKHSDKYMQCAKVLQYPSYAEELLKGISNDFKSDNVDVVIAPATGGIIVGYELARQLGCKNIFAERENGEMTIRRGLEIERGTRVLVAEDVTTTGGTVQEIIDLSTCLGAEVVGVALLVDRSMGAVDFKVKTRSAYAANVVAWEANDCPLCKEEKIPAVKPGSRGLK